MAAHTYKRARVEEHIAGRVPQANEYSGFTLGVGCEVEKLSLLGLSPETLYKEFVARRRPLLIDGLLPESDGFRGSKWTLGYLRDKAGHADVKVEWRHKAGDSFGQGREKVMKFSDFIGELERKSELVYLTTQELDEDDSGRPQLMSAPLTELTSDFRMRPELMGALIPQNVNLWMGYSRGQGSSSGLHHDFHDNLYVLLKGRKTFRLFSPADAHRLYTEGEILKVHPNGRINYVGAETRADGAHPKSETAAWAAELVDRAAVEAEVAAAQAAVDRGDEGAEKRLAAAEDELERALEAVLDAECEINGEWSSEM